MLISSNAVSAEYTDAVDVFGLLETTAHTAMENSKG